MKKLNIDLFKFSLVVILFGFLFLFYQYSQNGRFYLANDSNSIIDTRTGTVWDIYNNGERGNSAELYSRPLTK